MSSGPGGRNAAGAIALINALGNLGGFAGPFLIGWIKTSTGSYSRGLVILAGGVLSTGVIAMLIGDVTVKQNALSLLESQATT